MDDRSSAAGTTWTAAGTEHAARTALVDAQSSGFDPWVAYFEANTARQQRLERDWDRSAPVALSDRQRRGLVRSFQRLELGEGGDGVRLLSKARAAGDPVYTRALELLVSEEQKHSALFGVGLRRMGAPSLRRHWSDSAFTRLRRLLGLRTEIALFMIAEAVSVEYFEALADHAPDPILRGIGERIRTDEREHLRFQVDGLRAGFADASDLTRAAVGVAWWVVAVGAATVLCVDHAEALRACGRRPLGYWGRALRRFRSVARSALWSGHSREPSEPDDRPHLLGPEVAIDAAS
ncbi:ferritin-like domain-containing protein [Curtobacterium sp. MCBD17_028]|uniref:ferritin-like domain-containing protein n=1 Tax=Curtobacterium sp. MCBD17_028 TaxID=2175670 RepID=UPI0021AD4043|nr:ferritin-like domain-containing protein [Curtobacterium sp. MCBD17_028]